MIHGRRLRERQEAPVGRGLRGGIGGGGLERRLLIAVALPRERIVRDAEDRGHESGGGQREAASREPTLDHSAPGMLAHVYAKSFPNFSVSHDHPTYQRPMNSPTVPLPLPGSSPGYIGCPLADLMSWVPGGPSTETLIPSPTRATVTVELTGETIAGLPAL